MLGVRTRSQVSAVLCGMVMLFAGFRLANAQALTDFTIAVFQSELYLTDYVVKDKGFGAKHALNVKFVTPASGAAAAQLMLAGAIQGWTTDPLIILNAANQGHDIKMAGIVTPNLIYTILVAKEGRWPAEDAPFAEKMAGLKGKRIGVSGIGAGTDNALILMLKAAGLSAVDVTRVGIGQQQAAIGQLGAGSIDAFVSFSLAGNAMIQQQTGARLYITTRAPIVPEVVRSVPHAAFAVAGDFAAKNAKQVTGWLAAEQEAMAWIRSNADEAATILDKHVFNGQQPELARKILPQMLNTYFMNVPAGFKISQKAFAALLGASRELATVQPVTPATYATTVLPSARGD